MRLTAAEALKHVLRRSPPDTQQIARMWWCLWAVWPLPVGMADCQRWVGTADDSSEGALHSCTAAAGGPAAALVFGLNRL